MKCKIHYSPLDIIKLKNGKVGIYMGGDILKVGLFRKIHFNYNDVADACSAKEMWGGRK